MQTTTHQGKTRQPFRRTARSDRIARLGIGGAGVLVFVLLAWSHLGLGAWFFPPAATASQQTSITGNYQLVYTAHPDQLTVHGPNDIALTLRDRSGHVVTNATMAIQANMVTMAMAAPAVTATSNGDDRYHAQLALPMAGDWHISVHITLPGQPTFQLLFTVSVRWS